jgi:cobalt-zinc-cadmium efflux system membrane fusion protein
MRTTHWTIAVTLVTALGGGIYGYLEFFASDTEITPAAACEKHEIEECPFCRPEVIEQMGFCTGHGVPEAVCTQCRGDLEGAFRTENDWCQGHGLPESHCEPCNPGVLDKWRGFGEPKFSSMEEPSDTVVSPFELARGEVARIHRQPALTCATERSIIRLSSPTTARDAGLVVATTEKSLMRKTLEAPAELEYDARRHVRLAPRANGVIQEVRCDLGQEVNAGDVVAVVDSPALGTAKSELLQAVARVQLWEQNASQEGLLLEKKLSTQRDALEAETKLVENRIQLQAAEQRLRNLGLTEKQIREVREQDDTGSLLYLKAPFAGVVVGLDAVVGERAGEDSTLVTVADTSRMWAILDVDARDVRHIAEGQAVLFAMDGQEDQVLGGQVSWISTNVDRRTRTIKVRAELENSGGLLRAHGFGTGRIITRDSNEAVLVPKSAVQWEGCCNIAFVRRSGTEFVPKKLLLGYETGEHYEVLRGLSGGEEVVTQGSFLLKTELKKESIGAGCCEVDYLSQN